MISCKNITAVTELQKVTLKQYDHLNQETLTEREGSVHLVHKVACFVTKKNSIFNIKMY